MRTHTHTYREATDLYSNIDTHKLGLNNPVSACSTSVILTKIFCPGIKHRLFGESKGTGGSWILAKGILFRTK